MKTSLTAALVVLLSSQVQASGFYQDIVGNAPQSHNDEYSVNHETVYSPLYEKVIAHDPRFVAEKGTRVENFSYTPLYLRVTGQDRNSIPRLVKNAGSVPDKNI